MSCRRHTCFKTSWLLRPLTPESPPTYRRVSSVFTIRADKRLRNVFQGRGGWRRWVMGALNSPSLHRLSGLNGQRESKQSEASCFQESYLWVQMTGFYLRSRVMTPCLNADSRNSSQNWFIAVKSLRKLPMSGFIISFLNAATSNM